MADQDEVREVPLPANWYMGAHGDPIAQFDYIVLRLHPDGTVTWFDGRLPAAGGGSDV